MKRFVVYYPESPGEAGTDLSRRKSQRRDIERFVGEEGKVLREFSDSDGTGELPELSKAIAYAEKRKATVVIPELTLTDQCARLLQRLKNSAVMYHFILMPDANQLTRWVMDDVFPKATRDERSRRARAAMQAARERGVKLGTPENLTAEAQKKGVRVRQENARNDENNREAAVYCAGYKAEGKSFAWIAERLNEIGLKTRRGDRWTKGNLYRIWRTYESEMNAMMKSLSEAIESGKQPSGKKR
jgi:DNA invertase Pin-like site-specific DNA recombinase